MNANRRITIIAGALYFVGTFAGILSIVPAVDAPDYLLKASANANQVLIGALSFRYYIYGISKHSGNVSTIDIITPTYFALNIPLILLEMVLAIWFIAKGFDSNRLPTLGEEV
jgi:hypothetical protein